MNFAEILTPQNLSMTPPVQVLPPLSTYVQALKNAVPPPGGIAVTPGDPPTPAENSACLLLALSKARGGIVFNPEDLASNVVADTDLNGLNELVDGWRQPIVFYRWPFGNQELQNLNPAVPGSRESAFADPEDPEGRLVTPNPYNPYPTLVPGAWWTGTGRLYFEMLCHSVSLPNPPVPPLFQPNPPFPKEYYMVPVIASAGPNKSYGLLPAVNTFGSPYPSPFWPNPMLPDGSGDDNDNIYSYRLRLGAQGN